MDGLVYALAIVAVAALLWFANRKGRPVERWRLVLKPAAFCGATLFVFATAPWPAKWELALDAAAAVSGVGVGYLIVRSLSFNAENRAVLTRASGFGVLLFVLLFAGRFALRAATNDGHIFHRLAHHPAAAMAFIGAGFVFLVALSIVQSWGTWQRSKPWRSGRSAHGMQTPPRKN